MLQKDQNLFGNPVNASMKQVGVEDVQGFKCLAKNCSIYIKVVRCHGGLSLYERNDHVTGMPYGNINHHESPHDLNPANPNIRPTTLSIQQMETILNNWGILTIRETIHKIKNGKEIIVNKTQLTDIEKFKKTVFYWSYRPSTRAKQIKHDW